MLTIDERDRLLAYCDRDVSTMTLDELQDYAVLLKMYLKDLQTIGSRMLR